MKRKHRNVKKILSLALISFLFLFNHETLISYFYSFQIDWTIILFILSLLLAITFFIKQSSLFFDLKTIMIYFLFIISILLTMIVSKDFSGGYFFILLLIFTSLFFNSFIDKIFFYKTFLIFTLIISCFSIISRLVFIINPTFIQNNFIVVTNSENVSFYNLFFSFLVDYVSYFRVFGIYREPGVFAFFLIIALVFNLFLFTLKTQLLISLIIITAIIMTGSTPGYLSLLLVILAYFYNEIFLVKRIKLFYFLLFPIIGFFTFIYLSEVIFDAISKLSFENSSLIIRLFSIYSNFQVGIINPFNGVGITKGLGVLYRDYLSENLFNYSFTSTDNTSTHGAMFASFGSLFTFLFLILNLKFVISFSKNLIIASLILVSIILSLNSQLYLYSEVTYILFFSSLNHIKKL